MCSRFLTCIIILAFVPFSAEFAGAQTEIQPSSGFEYYSGINADGNPTSGVFALGSPTQITNPHSPYFQDWSAGGSVDVYSYAATGLPSTVGSGYVAITSPMGFGQNPPQPAFIYEPASQGATFSQDTQFNLYLYPYTYDGSSNPTLYEGVNIGTLDVSGQSISNFPNGYDIQLNSSGLAALNQSITSNGTFGFVLQISAPSDVVYEVDGGSYLVASAAPEPSAWLLALFSLTCFALVRMYGFRRRA